MLGWKRKPKDYLGDVAQMIGEMGLQTQKQPDNSLLVYCVSKKGSSFRVRFFIHDDDLVFESPFKKSVSGTNRNVAIFSEALLAYNSKMTKVYFSLVQGKSGWLILLRGTGEYKLVSPDFLFNIFEYFNFAYSEFIPEIEDLATELKLEFNGNSLINDMFN